MNTVLVTGACGYIGTHVVEELSRLGSMEIVALDARVNFEKSVPGVKYLECDFLASNSWKEDIGIIPDICLHLAWRNGFSHNDPSHILDLSGHFSFLKELIDIGVSQIAVMGTMHEVGYWEGAISETTPCKPLSFYGIAKNALREAFLNYAKAANVKAQWLRAYYITGDDEKSQSIFGKIVRAANSDERMFPFTSGKNKYDFIDVRNLAQQISACIAQDQITGIIECCSGAPISLGERVQRFIDDNHLDIKLDYGAYPDRPYDSPAVWGDDKKIRSILNA